MSWISMLTPLQWVALGLVPPLIFLLYFLKLRRVPVEVPSTYLWTKTVEDMHVNDIWQKLRKNLLLLLQLLTVLMLILSCLRPGCQGESLVGERFIFVIDQSASMSATDIDGGVTRLEEAKKQALNLVERMKNNDAGMVISFSDRSVVQQSYTTNKSLLRRKVKAIKQTERGSDINEALLAASGLANPGRTSDKASGVDVQVAAALEAKLFILSDGAVKNVPKFKLGNLTAEYRPIGSFSPPDNVGITAFAINDSMDVSGQVQVFARIQNSGMEDKQVGISLYVDDVLQDARGAINIPGLGSTGLNFDLTSMMEGLDGATPIKLKIDEDDIYMQDNEAFCILNPPRLANVLVLSDYKKYLELATSTAAMKKLAMVQYENRDYIESKDFKEKSQLGFYDLVIFDQCVPEEMPVCNTVFWGSLPPVEGWKIVDELETTPITDVDSSHPLMFEVQMGNVYILTGKTLEGPQGSTQLIDSAKGTVMEIGPRGGFEDLVIGFNLVEYEGESGIELNSNWHKKLSFPLFVQNVLSILGGSSQFRASRANPPGVAVKLKTKFPYDTVNVQNPKGSNVNIRARKDNSFVYSRTEGSGVYTVTEPDSGDVDQLFAINLLDRNESDLIVRDEMKLGYTQITATTTTKQARKDYWSWLVILALILLTVDQIVIRHP